MTALAVQNDTAVKGAPIIAHPWGDFDTVLRHAEKARVSGEPNRAHAFFARAIELNPNEPRAWAGLAATAPTLDEAIISWAYTFALAPDNLEAKSELDARVQERLVRARRVDAAVLSALGRTLAQVGQRPWAYRLLLRATELDPRHEEAWLWRAGVAADNEETIACLKQVLLNNPDNQQARVGLKWAEARATPAAAPVSADAAQEAESFFDQGQRALRTGNMERAYDFFRGATNFNPEHESAWYWRGSVAPNTDDALACMERVLTLNPQNATAKDALWLLRIRKIREAVKRTPVQTENASAARSAWRASSRARRGRGAVLSILVSIVIILPSIAIAGWIWLTLIPGR
jgi:tetratricopeptide (TPR) repeat protein